MQIAESVENQVTILAVSGRVDSSTSGALDESLQAAIVKAGSLVVDFSEARYISSAGLRALLKAAKAARASGRRLALCGLSPLVHEVFDVSGFSSLFEIHADRGEAVSALA